MLTSLLQRQHARHSLQSTIQALLLRNVLETAHVAQDTMVNLESLRAVLEKAFTAAGIDERPFSGSIGSHQIGMAAANALPPPQPRRAHVNVALATAEPRQAGGSGTQQEAVGALQAGDSVSIADPDGITGNPAFAKDSDAIAHSKTTATGGAAESKDKGKEPRAEMSEAAQAQRAASGINEPLADDEPDDNDIDVEAIEPVGLREEQR